MTIENLTIKEAKQKLKEYKELQAMFGIQDEQPDCKSQEDIVGPFQIGKNYLIRTVTMTQVGKLKAVYEKELVLEDGSWIADTGRFNEALKNGGSSLSEVEPFYGNPIIGRGAIVDAIEWKHDINIGVK